jgi:hypothetical protein
MQHGPAASSGSNPKAPGSAGGYLLRREIEANLMPSLAAMHERVANELSKVVPPASDAQKPPGDEPGGFCRRG